jgi:hypothetical protein
MTQQLCEVVRLLEGLGYRQAIGYLYDFTDVFFRMVLNQAKTILFMTPCSLESEHRVSYDTLLSFHLPKHNTNLHHSETSNLTTYSTNQAAEVVA